MVQGKMKKANPMARPAGKKHHSGRKVSKAVVARAKAPAKQAAPKNHVVQDIRAHEQVLPLDVVRMPCFCFLPGNSGSRVVLLAQKVTSRIHKNIEEIMAARHLQSGGHLRVVSKPKHAVDLKSRPKMGKAPEMKAHGVQSRVARKESRKEQDKKKLIKSAI